MRATEAKEEVIFDNSCEVKVIFVGFLEDYGPLGRMSLKLMIC